jgi:hypothetical protein
VPDNAPENPIPPGCHWAHDTWIQPPLLQIPERQLKVIQTAAALESLSYGLHRFLVAMERHLTAEKLLKRAIRRLRTADGLRQHVTLPDPPWLLDGQIVLRKAEHFSVLNPTDVTVPWKADK